MMFSLFWDTVSILSILPSGEPIRDPLGVTPRSPEHFFSDLRQILYFSMIFSLFWDTVTILSILPSGGPIRDAPWP